MVVLTGQRVRQRLEHIYAAAVHVLQEYICPRQNCTSGLCVQCTVHGAPAFYTFFTHCIALQCIGYPMHWISAVTNALSCGEVKRTVPRPAFFSVWQHLALQRRTKYKKLQAASRCFHLVPISYYAFQFCGNLFPVLVIRLYSVESFVVKLKW